MQCFGPDLGTLDFDDALTRLQTNLLSDDEGKIYSWFKIGRVRNTFKADLDNLTITFSDRNGPTGRDISAITHELGHLMIAPEEA